MELNADADIPFERGLVFAAYRDQLPKLVEYLPNIRRIEVVSRTDEGDTVELENIWYGGGDIPGAARAVLSESMLSWRDFALWDQTDWSCSWRIETKSFTEAVRCEGSSRFFETPDGTRMEVRGEIEIDASKIAGIPKLLRSRVGNTVAEFLSKKITPNLVDVSTGLSRYLEKQAVSK